MHMTMEVPLKGLFKGRLLEPAKSDDTDSRFRSRVDHASLEASGLKVVIAALIANPMIGKPEQQIEEQIAILHEFVKRHPNWKIASEPDDVLNQTAKGNKVILFSLEGAWAFKDGAAFEALLSKHPIRFVTPFHFTDIHSKIGRAARQRGAANWAQRFFAFFHRKPKSGFTAHGDELLKIMLERKIWIDLSHAPDEFSEYFLNARPKGYPLLVTHTVLAKYYGLERGISESLVKALRSDDGAVGLLPSVDMLEGTPSRAAEGLCGKGQAFLAQWKEMSERIGAQKVYLGSDFNAPIPTIPPLTNTGKCAKPFLPGGLVTAKDLAEIVALQDKSAIANFVRTWKLVRPY